MSGGGGKPKGGKMGTSIRATNVSGEAVTIAEKELSTLTDKLNAIRQRMVDAVKRYQAAEKTIAALDMELAKSQKEVMLIFESTGTFMELWVPDIEFFFPSSTGRQFKFTT
jgi:exonuclease VII small subunit